MQGFQFFDVILLALLAGFIAFRLYTVLGRRTGHERSPDDQLRLPDGARPNPKAPAAKDNVVSLPERAAQAGAALSCAARYQAARPRFRHGALPFRVAASLRDDRHRLCARRA
jgi:hypothetical protein